MKRPSTMETAQLIRGYTPKVGDRIRATHKGFEFVVAKVTADGQVVSDREEWHHPDKFDFELLEAAPERGAE